MRAMRRPLNNAEQVYRAAYLDLCSLYTNGPDNEAEQLAWRYYQDPNIPLILRIMCCNVLGEAEDGEYLHFAREAVQHATTAAELEPDNETAQLMLKESKEILTNAEEDAREQLADLPVLLNECKQAEADANELAAALAARNPAAQSQESQSQHSIMSPSASALPESVASVSSTPLMKASTTFTPISSPQGPSWKEEGEDASEDHHDK